MKKMSLKVSSLLSSICATTLAMLGFGCSEDFLCMYGSPTGSYEVKGTVKTIEGEPMPDVEIRTTLPEIASGVESLTVTKTGSEGNYESAAPFYPQRIKVVCTPTDTEYEADSAVVQLKYQKPEGASEWEVGHGEATVNFNLHKKK